MKELLEKKFKDREELDKFLKLSCGFALPTVDELNEWPYKSKLNISPSFLYGRRVFVNGEDVGGVEKLSREKIGTRDGVVIYTHTGNKIALSNAKVEYYDGFKKEFRNISVHPTKNKTLWEKGFVINEYDYKKLYYQTEEYREQYEKTLNENNGTVGIKAPIQNKKIKDKISSTISERYGVDWFLDRGKHYSSVTLSMLEKHGVENVFLSEDWQIKMHKIKNDITIKDCKEDSKLEREVVSKINEIFFHEDNFFYESKKGQYYVKSNLGEKMFYKLDFYNPVKKIVVEVMGDYWHCNPNIYQESFFNKNKNMFAKDIWISDNAKKQEVISGLNCLYHQIWEQDWNNDKESVLEQLKNEFEQWEQLK